MLNLPLVKKELESWVVSYLDVPSKFYNNLKPCPFARQAWFNNEVNVVLGKEKEVTKQINSWDDSFNLVAIIFEEWEDVEDWCAEKNKSICEDDLYLMCFSPDSCEWDDPQLETFSQKEFKPLIDDIYGWVFLQRLSTVNRYSNILEKQGYYKNVSHDFWEYITTRRMYDGKSK
jgi:hypothetical protein